MEMGQVIITLLGVALVVAILAILYTQAQKSAESITSGTDTQVEKAFEAFGD